MHSFFVISGQYSTKMRMHFAEPQSSFYVLWMDVSGFIALHVWMTCIYLDICGSVIEIDGLVARSIAFGKIWLGN